MWLDHDVRAYGEGTKFIRPAGGEPLALEYSSFVVDGQAGLGMVIYTPATSVDAERVQALIARRRERAAG